MSISSAIRIFQLFHHLIMGIAGGVISNDSRNNTMYYVMMIGFVHRVQLALFFAIMITKKAKFMYTTAKYASGFLIYHAVFEYPEWDVPSDKRVWWFMATETICLIALILARYHRDPA